jgi:2-oxoisovalerate dehydrogenase E2 component (dihydrolipoyl transacylase)
MGRWRRIAATIASAGGIRPTMTVRDFYLPDLGEGLEDAEIVRWLVSEGDVVTIDQPVVEVVTAKAAVELPSPYAGVVVALHHGVGDIAAVGSALVSIGDAADAAVTETAAAGTAESAATAATAAATTTPAESAATAATAASTTTPTESVAAAADPATGESGGSGSVLVGYGTRPERRRRRRSAASSDAPVESRTPAVMSPVVRRLARDLEVDLSTVEASGPDGVITRSDVERAAGDFGRAAAAEPGDGATERPTVDTAGRRDDSTQRPTVDTAGLRDGSTERPNDVEAGADDVERIPIRGVRRQMAEHLARSRREIPEATVWVDADASGLLEAKRAIDGANHDRSNGVGIASWLARFCVLGLRRWPLLNSRIDGDEIVVSRKVHLGIAAQTDRGLVVPVVHHAEEMNLLELDDEIRRLATAARAGTLTRAEVTGGSFTLNNYGVFGVDGSAAIINSPEVAIVGVGRILQRPWVVDGEVRPRPVTELTLAFDHRVCDGAVAGGFLRFLADCVEQPVRLLTL